MSAETNNSADTPADATMKNILFYKYVLIEHPEQFQEEHLAFCRSLGLKGKVLVGTEGINGCVSGPVDAIEQYKAALRADARFADVEFKEGSTARHTFKKMFVRVRQEIVTLGLDRDVDLTHKAPYIEPEELKRLYESGDEFYIVDARNDYEYAIGHFENAIDLGIKTFRDFPEAVKKIEHLKEKPVVTFCTGGIRCEKASAFLREQGFENVRQLHGGIIRYGEHCSTSHYEGKCFVFDQRVAIEVDPKKSTAPITPCVLCRMPCDDYHNCAHHACDARFIACSSCLARLGGCCSKNCKHIVEHRVAQQPAACTQDSDAHDPCSVEQTV